MEDILLFLQSSSAGLSLGTIVTAGIIAILAGGLVPVRSHNREIKLLEGQLIDLAQERDDWKAAYLAKSDEATQLRQQVTDLTEAGKTTSALLDSMRTLFRSNSREVED